MTTHIAKPPSSTRWWPPVCGADAVIALLTLLLIIGVALLFLPLVSAG
jgi:hypothetical protein